ncbi:hypothetical protein ACHAWO_007795 [Cyclotella atomus]|uniref:SET domain-containing protein n=1 Tax=Cyclotella atomus TaxID=382360 RepID=A0ABD3QVW4_9STRA
MRWILLILATMARVQCDDAHQHRREYQIMYAEAERVKKEDLSLLEIKSSSIHGRGVVLTRPVKQDSSVGVLYYEVVGDNEDRVQIEEGYWHARGYITDGGMIDRRHMSVKDAITRCDELPDCQGITFEDPDGLFSNAHSKLPSILVDVEFKDKNHFGTDPQDSWQSFLKQQENLDALYFPLGCSSSFLPNPPPSSLDPILMLPCWPRYNNHSCDPTAKVVKVPVEDSFALPGVPWKRVVGAYQVVLLKDLDEGEEITLNYEALPNYMLRRVEGVEKCNKLHDEL